MEVHFVSRFRVGSGKLSGKEGIELIPCHGGLPRRVKGSASSYAVAQPELYEVRILWQSLTAACR